MAPPRDVQLKNKRMDFVSQLDKSIFALIVYGYFLDPLVFVLIIRGITQTQISRPHESHPTSSQRTMTILLLFNYVVSTAWIAMFGSTGTERETKGVFLDFVGQATPTSPLHLHLLCLLLLILQSLCLLIAFESTPSPSFPDSLPTPTPIPTPGSPPPIPMPPTISIVPPTPLTPSAPSPPSAVPPPLRSPSPELEEEEEEEDFLSLFLPRFRGARRRTGGGDAGEEEEETLIDWPKGGQREGEEGEEGEDEGGSIMVLRLVPTLGRLLGFRWGVGRGS